METIIKKFKLKGKYIIVLLLLGWLLAANQIVTKICVDKEQRLIKFDFNEEKSQNVVHTFAISINDEEDIFDTVTLNGVAFCTNDEGTMQNNREIEIILKSKDSAYKVSGTSCPRPDIYAWLYDKMPLFGAEIGFQASFSTLNLPYDIYELYLGVKENEQIFGIGKTNFTYIKNRNGFKNYYEEINDLKLKEAEIVFRLDNISLDNRVLELNGWQYMNETNSELEKVYFQIIKDNTELYTIAARTNIRSDIAEAFGNNEYIKSGIGGEYENLDLDDGEYLIKVIVQIDNNYYVSNELEKFTIQNQTVVEREHLNADF